MGSLVSQIPNFVRRQPGSSLIGRFVGSLEPLQNLNQLMDLNLSECKQLTGAFLEVRVWGAQPARDFIG